MASYRDAGGMVAQWWRRPGMKYVGAVAGVVLPVLALLRLSPFSLSPVDALGIKIYLLAGAFLLALFWTRIPQQARVVILLVLAVIAALNYFRWGPRSLYERVDVYDVAHYYLGAKYFPELGYEGLYPALILADRENGPKSTKLNRYRLQTDRGYEYRDIEDALSRGRAIRETRFSAERWKNFERDSLVLLRDIGLGADSWRKLVGDRGFNGSPAWIAVARPFAAVVPVRAVKLLCLVDVLLIASALCALGYAYGWRIALWAVVFLTASYSMRWPVAGEAMFRYIWLSALMWALALVKAGPPAAAGAALAVSSLMRLFPAAWLFGPLAQALHQFDRNPYRLGNISPYYWRMVAGFIGCVLLAFVWISVDPGIGSIADHIGDMRIHVHVDQLVSRHVGFAKALIFEGGLEPRNMTQADRIAIAELKPVTGFLALCILIALALGVRTLPADQAFSVGFIPFFLLSTAHDYYGVSRVVLIVFHACRLDNRWDRVCLAWLLLLELFACWTTVQYPDHIAFRIGYLAWGTTAYILMVTAVLVRDWWTLRQVPAQDRRSPGS